MRYILIIVFTIFISNSLYAQNKRQYDSLYIVGQKAYANGDCQTFIECFSVYKFLRADVFKEPIKNESIADIVRAMRYCIKKNGSNTPQQLPSIYSELTANSKSVPHKLYFSSKTTTLASSEYSKIDKVIKYMKKNPAMVMEISSNSKDFAKGEKLNHERNNTIKDVMIYKGIDPSRLIEKGYGESSNKLPIGSDTVSNDVSFIELINTSQDILVIPTLPEVPPE